MFRCNSPRADLRGGGTTLLYRDGLDVNKVFSAERSSFKVSEWVVVFGSHGSSTCCHRVYLSGCCPSLRRSGSPS